MSRIIASFAEFAFELARIAIVGAGGRQFKRVLRGTLGQATPDHSAVFNLSKAVGDTLGKNLTSSDERRLDLADTKMRVAEDFASRDDIPGLPARTRKRYFEQADASASEAVAALSASSLRQKAAAALQAATALHLKVLAQGASFDSSQSAVLNNKSMIYSRLLRDTAEKVEDVVAARFRWELVPPRPDQLALPPFRYRYYVDGNATLEVVAFDDELAEYERANATHLAAPIVVPLRYSSASWAAAVSGNAYNPATLLEGLLVRNPAGDVAYINKKLRLTIARPQLHEHLSRITFKVSRAVYKSIPDGGVLVQGARVIDRPGKRECFIVGNYKWEMTDKTLAAKNGSTIEMVTSDEYNRLKTRGTLVVIRPLTFNGRVAPDFPT
jgi:hypothetical protein